MQTEILIHETASGRKPFIDFFIALDSAQRDKVKQKLERLRYNHFGDYKNLDGNLFELRFKSGGGLRIYFGKIESTIILLLCGGNKGTQKRDIEKAKKYWGIYNEQKTKKTIEKLSKI